ncbi:MAG: DUF937 domain-containing protein [Woeseiaceae bacterium]|nr:DUF937 domain-containing protein [Woeseiaceae bacterium]
MNLMDLLKSSGGGDSVGKLADAVGLGSGDTSKLVDALAPALMGGLKKNAGDDSGLAGLRRALETGGHDRYLDDPGLMGSADTRVDGNRILGHIFGSKDVSRNVAAAAAGETGIDAGVIKKALPLLATLAMGALNKKSSAGQDIGASAKSGGLGPLGDLLDIGGKSGLDDILGMAKKLF